MNDEGILRCQTCHVVKDAKITEELFPLQELDDVDPKVYYCKICGYLFMFDEHDELDAIININEKLLFPKLRSIIFGLDTTLHKAVRDILEEVKTDEYLYDKNRKLCAVEENMMIGNTELKKIKKNISNEIFKIFDMICKQEKNSLPPGFISEEYIQKVKETINSNIHREII
jgi:hypothetical protein